MLPVFQRAPRASLGEAMLGEEAPEQVAGDGHVAHQLATVHLPLDIVVQFGRLSGLEARLSYSVVTA